MIQRLDYGDHIFFLAVRVRSLRDSARLNLRSDIFIERIHEDITFVEKAIDRLSLSLKDGSLMKNRTEYLRNINRLIRDFTVVLTQIVDGEATFSEELKDQFEAYRGSIKRFWGEAEKIDSLIESIVGTSREGEFIISEEEYKILLSDSDDRA